MSGEKKTTENNQRSKQEAPKTSEQSLPKDYKPFYKSMKIMTDSDPRFEKIKDE